MPEDSKKDFNYEFHLRGYGVVVLPSDVDDDHYYVSVSEMGKPVYEMDVPLNFERDDAIMYNDYRFL
jgi:hypothetical protein